MKMKTALEYTLDLERELNRCDGIENTHLKLRSTFDAWEDESYISNWGSRIIEKHIKKVMEDARQKTTKS